MIRLADDNIKRLAVELENKSAEDVLKWAVQVFNIRLVFACSFGAEDVALVDMLCKCTSSPRVIFLDTGRLNQETYDVVDQIRVRYSLEIEVYAPQTQAVENLMRSQGANSFYDSIEQRRECCYVRKVEPLSRALANTDAWITGLRRSQSQTRIMLPVIEMDEAHGGITKINPLASWCEADVWSYIRANEVPYSKLHDNGYPSVGCAPCTRAIKPGEDVRAGRWWWESAEQKECGLHIREGKVIR